ncbi:VCBS repeat-containing protein [Streptomyces sp. ODS05-4]|uniref:FG-GAP-like repeat-containing protein n=1 Tax=Streptomyces sp. ODS05-4 TaxID=2944939 RepID=UPI00210AD423|nr:VCBS repeat-containing protein [Streptomyces sp. ODS05-4]
MSPPISVPVARRRALLGLALTPALVLAAAVPAPAASSASPGPAARPAAAAPAAAQAAGPVTVPDQRRAPGSWGAGARVIDPAAAHNTLLDLVSAGNGTLVSLTLAPGGYATRVRPAGATGWLAPKHWASTAGTLKVIAPGDGSVRVLWRAERDGDPDDVWLRTATLAPGATAFSEPEDIAPVSGKGYGHLAAAPDGRLVAAWVVSGVVRTAEKAGPGAAWTAPVDLNEQPPSGHRDISHLELAVAKDGTALLVWQWMRSTAVVAMEKAPGAGGWSQVRDLPLPAQGVSTRPKAFAGGRGGFDVFYEQGERVVHTGRAAGASRWSTPRPLTGHSSYTDTLNEPITLPNGDLFVAGSTTYPTGPWSAVRSAATGVWTQTAGRPSATATVSSFRTAATSGGTVTATWREGSTGKDRVMTALFQNGAWSAPRRLSATGVTSTGHPGVAADALGRPVALWDQYQLSEQGAFLSDGVWQATTTARSLPAWRDHTDDGKADVLGVGPSGLKAYAGDAAKLTAGPRTSVWPKGALVLPFGDLDGDACNDVFVRSPKGEARVYPTVCGGLPDPAAASVKVASDWSGYNAVLSPGDLTGDGRADLLTRSASTGRLYVFAQNGAGGFKAGALAGSGFGGYKRLIAGGDVDRDGRGDLLAIDGSNELWRFRGTGAGAFGSRSLIFKDWGTSYQDVVGGLDLSGDGRADLVSLDKDGRAWLNRGDGKGGFANRTQAGKATDWAGVRIS